LQTIGTSLTSKSYWERGVSFHVWVTIAIRLNAITKPFFVILTLAIVLETWFGIGPGSSNLGASGYEIVINSYPPLRYFKVF
jgi:hypothetical protein